MKAQLIIVTFYFALASCKKNASEVTPTPQPLDTNINLVGTWHIDAVMYYTMNLEKLTGNLKDRFNSYDSIKFYNSLQQDLSFKTCSGSNRDNYYYQFDNQLINFVEDSPLTSLPLPGIPFGYRASRLWKQVSNDNGFLTKLNSGYSFNFNLIDKDTLTFKISRTANRGVRLTLEPFIEYTMYRDNCSGFDFAALDGYYIKLYLTQNK